MRLGPLSSPSVSVAGTANQVLVNGGTTASTGLVTLTLPQDIGTTSQVTFGKVNGLTISTTTGTLTIANAKTFTASNTLTLAGTDGSTLNVGTGGTLGTGAFAAQTTITGTANELTASASTGAVTLSLPTALTFTGKTVTGGIFNATAFNGSIGVTTPSTGRFTNLFLNTTGTNLSEVAAGVVGVGTGTATSVAGSMSMTNITLGASGQMQFSGKTLIKSVSDGDFLFFNSTGTDFTRLMLGGTTTSFPSIKRSSATIQIRLADDSGFAATQDLYNRFGSGTPEGVVTAPVGATYRRTDGGAGTSFYVKESGTGNTGWVAK